MSGEASATFRCFGSTCSVFVIGDGAAGSADDAVTWARERLLTLHRGFSRFEPDSELTLMNANRRHAVRVSPTMARLALLGARAAELTDGLVDPTLLGEVEDAGYVADLVEPVDLRAALAAAPRRRPAAPHPAERWRLLRVDRRENLVFRPPGLLLDSGGLAKGLFCDVLAETLETHAAYAIDCGGDVRVGGHAHVLRAIHVSSPFGGHTLHTFTRSDCAAATSGIGRRSWLDEQGQPCHHLLDPSTGRPAFTGVVQVTALAATGALAEVCAKAALLSGPAGASGWLPDGGVIVYDDGHDEIVEPALDSQETPSFI